MQIRILLINNASFGMLTGENICQLKVLFTKGQKAYYFLSTLILTLLWTITPRSLSTAKYFSRLLTCSPRP